MTDYWVSSKKHYCETCNCWISGHKVNIKNHERSTRHIENFKNLLNKSFKRREQETKDKEFIEKELKKLENVEKKFLSDLQKNDISNKSNSSINLNTCHSNNKNRISNSSNNITSNNVTNYVSSGQGNKKWVVMIHEDTGSLLFYNRLKNGITYEKPKDFFDYLPEYETFSEQNGWFKNNIINVTTERTGSSGNYEDINNAFSFNSYEQNCRDAKSTMVESTCKSDERDVKYVKCEKDKTHMNEENITNGGNNSRGESKLDKKSEKTYYTNIEEEKQLNKNNLDIGNKNKNTNISIFYKKADSTVSIPDDKKKKIHNKKENIEKTDKPNTREQIEEGDKVKIDLISKPGAWESVEDSEINTISNEKIEQIFYNIKSKEEIEKEEITQLEEDIRYEYSAHNEFYVKKKELENEDIFLSQEFKFVSKPIYKKAIDKNLNKKVEFAKRSIKSIQNKKKIS
ncbi:U1 small nuclear ribonucleoprotein C, putative [Plasmodium malariae]|uniref:U1 small nuclear ribonucleoprotein C, putative n=1 Tax=Plasmodium malariae TaxID=5858 RepID=A0A1C3KFZ5_PLAMA|nr:U1 small nuclear ribonucleoprotein C, putative [Plasmodium malariae]